jgi:hypothetical protein
MNPFIAPIDAFHAELKDIESYLSKLPRAEFAVLWSNAERAWNAAISSGTLVWPQSPITAQEFESLRTGLTVPAFAKMMTAFDLSAVHCNHEVHPSVVDQTDEFVRGIIGIDQSIGILVAKILYQEDIVVEYETT